MDGIAQENNETFTLTIEMDPVFLGTKPEPIIRDRMTGIIQDSDCKFKHNFCNANGEILGSSDSIVYHPSLPFSLTSFLDHSSLPSTSLSPSLLTPHHPPSLPFMVKHHVMCMHLGEYACSYRGARNANVGMPTPKCYLLVAQWLHSVTFKAFNCRAIYYSIFLSMKMLYSNYRRLNI